MTLLSDEERRRGVVAATRGNHGLGVAFAGAELGIAVTICVPQGNNSEKNEGMRGYGATLVEEGRDYDESLAVALRLDRERGLHLVHSTNDPAVIAGAATLTLEILRAMPELDALVLSIGGGSQAVGAMTVARTLAPELEVYGVQAAGAPAAFDSWRAGRPVATAAAETFADGLATRSVYEATFGPLCEGLADFVTVTEAEIADALRLLLRTTHNLAEGAGAAGLAGFRSLRKRLAGKRVGDRHLRGQHRSCDARAGRDPWVPRVNLGRSALVERTGGDNAESPNSRSSRPRRRPHGRGRCAPGLRQHRSARAQGRGPSGRPGPGYVWTGGYYAWRKAASTCGCRARGPFRRSPRGLGARPLEEHAARLVLESRPLALTPPAAGKRRVEPGPRVPRAGCRGEATRGLRTTRPGYQTSRPSFT